jgi:hypothetical protein
VRARRGGMQEGEGREVRDSVREGFIDTKQCELRFECWRRRRGGGVVRRRTFIDTKQWLNVG